MFSSLNCAETRNLLGFRTRLSLRLRESRFNQGITGGGLTQTLAHNLGNIFVKRYNTQIHLIPDPKEQVSTSGTKLVTLTDLSTTEEHPKQNATAGTE